MSRDAQSVASMGHSRSVLGLSRDVGPGFNQEGHVNCSGLSRRHGNFHLGHLPEGVKKPQDLAPLAVETLAPFPSCATAVLGACEDSTQRLPSDLTRLGVSIRPDFTHVA